MQTAIGTVPGPDLQTGYGRSDWVRLRTLILLRWVAISGQLGAILAAQTLFSVRLDLPACLAAVGAAVAFNLFLMIGFPANRRLSETEAMATFLLDTGQLSALLALTGGLDNPFALLILAPVTIAATTLRTGPTIFVGTVTIGLVTLVAFLNRPLVLASGEELHAPGLFQFGYWLGIVVGVVFLGLYARRVSSEIHSMSEALLATQMALAREQKLTDLGGVVAAAAHELGTPLATIMLASSELAEELGERPDLAADARLIREQAARCRDILRAMGRTGKDDLHMRTAPLSEVLREAAEPHLDRGKAVRFIYPPNGEAAQRQPTLMRYPEVIHGLRNLIQNAVDFAASSVDVDASWNADEIRVRISDDGSGYPSDVLGRIGEPFVRSRGSSTRSASPQYEGMGLGLFIAKTLLERTGARLRFSNGGEGGPDPAASTLAGAVVEVVWPAERIAGDPGRPLGPNPGLGA